MYTVQDDFKSISSGTAWGRAAGSSPDCSSSTTPLVSADVDEPRNLGWLAGPRSPPWKRCLAPPAAVCSSLPWCSLPPSARRWRRRRRCGDGAAVDGGVQGRPARSPIESDPHGLGRPGRRDQYVMMLRPELAANLGTWYDIEWTSSPAPRRASRAGRRHARLRHGRRALGGQRAREGSRHRVLGELIESQRRHVDDVDGVEGCRHRLVDDLKGRPWPPSRRRLDRLYRERLHRAADRARGRRGRRERRCAVLPYAGDAAGRARRRRGVPQRFFAVVIGPARSFRCSPHRRDRPVRAVGERLPARLRRAARDAIEKFQQDWSRSPMARRPGNRPPPSLRAVPTGMPGDVLAGYLWARRLRPACSWRHQPTGPPGRGDFFDQRGALQTQLQVDDHVIRVAVP